MSMYGHTHADIFKSVQSISGQSNPVGVLTVCGSITTWAGINPSFCVYEVDKETLLPVERSTWSYDMTTANANGTPEWDIYTNWLEDYKMKDLSPSSYVDFLERLG
jgi:sphingomyelin phosphodiesterase